MWNSHGSSKCERPHTLYKEVSMREECMRFSCWVTPVYTPIKNFIYEVLFIMFTLYREFNFLKGEHKYL